MRRGGTILLLLCVALGWQGLSMAAGGAGLVAPLVALARLGVLLRAPPFWADVAATGQAFALALLISVAGGIGLGAALGMRRLAADVAGPLLVNFYSLPKVTLYPVVLLLFGLGMPAKVAFGVMHGIVPLTLFTMAAIQQIPPILLRTARVMRLSRRQTLTGVMLPAIVPEVLAGVRLSASLTLLGVLIGEMFASTRGLGHRVMTAMEAGDLATVLAVAVALAGFAVGLNGALLAAQRRAGCADL